MPVSAPREANFLHVNNLALIEAGGQVRDWTQFRLETSKDNVRHDVDSLLTSLRLHEVRRFMHQRFWEEETKAAEYAAQIEPSPRLETAAEHSWHVADAVMLLASHFPFVDEFNALRMAILHDKMEIYIGDRSPLGRDGTGRSTHAFNADSRWDKDRAEEVAISKYIRGLRPSSRPDQAHSLHEILHGRTIDARFVKAVDKLAGLAFVVTKKRGAMLDKHLFFTLRYSEKAVEYFPPLEMHYTELRKRLIHSLAKHRDTRVSDIEQMICQARAQLALF